jgi:hypothetical protein
MKLPNFFLRLGDFTLTLLRFLLIIVLFPYVLLAYILQALGELGDMCVDHVESLKQSISTTFKPKFWRQVNDLAQENLDLKAQLEMTRLLRDK